MAAKDYEEVAVGKHVGATNEIECHSNLVQDDGGYVCRGERASPTMQWGRDRSYNDATVNLEMGRPCWRGWRPISDMLGLEPLGSRIGRRGCRIHQLGQEEILGW